MIHCCLPLGFLQSNIFQVFSKMGVRQTRDPRTPRPKNPDSRIVLLGAGPASLSCATFLGRLGYDNITIYEKQDVIGGLRQGNQCMTIYRSLYLPIFIQHYRNTPVPFANFHGKLRNQPGARPGGENRNQTNAFSQGFNYRKPVERLKGNFCRHRLAATKNQSHFQRFDA